MARELISDSLLLAALFERMPMGIAIFDRDLCLQRFNLTWADFVYEYTPAAPRPLEPGMYYFDIDPGTEIDLMSVFARVLSGEVVQLKAYPIHSGDVVSYWDAVLTPIVRDGEIVGILDVINDVTQRERSQAALKRQVAFNRIVTDLSTNFINLPPEHIGEGIERALQIVGSFTGVDRSYIFLFSDDQATMSCIYEWSADGIEPQIARMQDISTEAFAWSNRQLLRGETLHIPSVAELPPEAATEQREFAAQAIRSLLVVPMQQQGQTLGFLGFDAVHSQKTWSAQNIALLRIVGEIFVNALEHRRSQAAIREAYETLEKRVVARTREIERRRQAAESLHDILKLLNSAQPLDEILHVIVARACQLLETDAGVIYHYDDDRRSSSAVAVMGMPTAFEALGPFPLTGTQAQRAIEQRRTHCVADFETYFAAITLPDEPVLRRWVALVREHFCAKLTAPIFILDEPYGAIELYYRAPRVFSEDAQTLALMIGVQAALAIENARLRIQAEQAAVAEERNRIARELHDSVSQALYGIALGARTARALVDREPHETPLTQKLDQPLDYVLSLAEAGLAEMRALIFELRPDALENEGLVAALRKQAEALRARHKLQVETDFCAEPPLPFKAKEALYRVAQEALNNAVKHAQATRLEVRLAGCADTLTLEISDDGTGFDPDGAYPGHLGLETMRERIARLGGALEIESAPGQGTTVRAVLRRLPQ